jgi:hypothetical protein
MSNLVLVPFNLICDMQINSIAKERKRYPERPERAARRSRQGRACANRCGTAFGTWSKPEKQERKRLATNQEKEHSGWASKRLLRGGAFFD